MDMSKAALPPKFGYASKEDEKDVLFSKYCEYRSSMVRLMVDCDDFKCWKQHYIANKENEEISNHPEFKNFQNWMKVNKGGGRKCPAGVFPNNFKFWLNGGRW